MRVRTARISIAQPTDTLTSYPSVICVGAVAKDYAKTDYSNYDKHVTFYAPGHHIYVPDSTGYDKFTYMDGTSFASPAVAAIVAHYKGFATIKQDAQVAIERLMQNAHKGICDWVDPNVFAHTGLRHPRKDSDCPYSGPQVCEHKAQDQESGMHSLVLQGDTDH
jgi:hypothetical protein